MDRVGLIGQLLWYEQPLPHVLAGLAAYGWDSDWPLAELSSSHIRHALRRYLHAELSAVQVEEWANAIECREDIAYEPCSPVGETLFELANPVLTLPLSLERAGELLQLLSADS
jgi:hypothetical protein